MAFERVSQILSTRARSLRALAKVAGGDPATFYRDADLSGADLRNQDLRGMSFDRANLHGVRVNYKTKADREVLTRLLQEGIAASKSLLEQEEDEFDACTLLKDLVLNCVALDRMDEADEYLGELSRRAPHEMMNAINPIELATAGLQSASAFLSRWFRAADSSNETQDYVGRLVASNRAPWVEQADVWVRDNFVQFKAPLIITLVRHEKIQPRMVATWLMNSAGSDTEWDDVAAWMLVLNGYGKSFQDDIVKTVFNNKRSLESEVLQLIVALTRGYGKSSSRIVGRIAPHINNYQDFLRFTNRALHEATAEQLQAIRHLRRPERRLSDVTRGLLDVFQPRIGKQQLNSYSLDYPSRLTFLIDQQEALRSKLGMPSARKHQPKSVKQDGG